MAVCKDGCLYESLCKYNDGINEWCKSNCPLFKEKSNVVRVVHCKDCDHFINYNPDRTYCEEHSDGWGDNRVYVDEDDYCSFGIRKKEGADNG